MQQSSDWLHVPCVFFPPGPCVFGRSVGLERRTRRLRAFAPFVNAGVARRHDVPFCRIRPKVELRGWPWRNHGPIQRLARYGGSSARIQEGFESLLTSALSSQWICRRGTLANYLCAWLEGNASGVWSRAGRVWPCGSSGCGCRALCTFFAPAP